MAKSPGAYRTISEAAEEVGVPQHVLRFWETRFTFLRPLKRAGGRRLYRPQDVTVLRAVRGLLHDRGYTIRGVQQLHRTGGLKDMVAEATPPEDATSLSGFQRVVADLEATAARLRAVLTSES